MESIIFKKEQKDKVLSQNFDKISGKIVKGRGVGKKIGFPTINLITDKLPIKLNGVFAGKVEKKGKFFTSAIFIGKAKTFQQFEKTIEIHILENDFFNFFTKKDQFLTFFLKQKIRSVKKFKDINTLKKQISKDCKKILQCQSNARTRGLSPLFPVLKLKKSK